MQLNNFRHKKKNLSKALGSIFVPYSNHQNLKLLTENAEIHHEEPKEYLKIIQNSVNNVEDRTLKGMRRFSRYKQNTEEEKDPSIGKYRSLELNRRGTKKRSEHKLNLYKSIDNSPYKPIREKKSANNLQALQHLAEPNYINKVVNRENRKSSLQKKFNLNVPKARDSILEKHKKITSSSCNELKDQAKIQLKKNNYGYALKLLEKANDESDSDIELLDLQGVCLMNMKKFNQALKMFTRVLELDKQYNKQLYISLAICENQLNHVEKCMFYINQCVQIFPDFYQGYYFKGKILYKQGSHKQALKELKEASTLNPHKRQIKLLMGDCYQRLGNHEKAVEYYDSNTKELDIKNIKYAVKLANMQYEIRHESEAAITFERCITFIDGMQNRNSQIDEYFLECTYNLSLIYYHQEKFEQSLMKGEEILKSMNSFWILKAIKIMIVIQIRQHNFYGAIYLIERLQYFKVNSKEIQQYIIFCEGVVLLMKKKIPEGLAKLQGLNDVFCKKERINELNHQINRVYHMYLYYSYFLIGKYMQALAEIQKQKIIGVDTYYEPILRYNEIVCKAIIQYNTLNYEKAGQYFEESLSIFPDKAESKLYIAITNFRLYFREQIPQIKTLIKAKILRCLNSCAVSFSQVNSNYAANIFYYRGLLHAWNGEWPQAACDLDIAIDKAEDSFINFFYLRALVLANLQNYRQAINDVSIALSIQEDNPSCYLLRARCLQIDGNPTQAFSDLQSFIDKLALRPQDRQIHKFAGHMLFENGAFEDALQAYSQGDIHKDDIEVYLTRSKTYFLIGNFLKSSADMLQAARIKDNEPEYLFDYQMIKWIGELFHQYVKDQCEDDYVFKAQILMQNLENLNKLYNETVQSSSNKYGKIFKLTEYLTLSSVCYFYLEDYDKAIDHFIEVIDFKKISLEAEEETEGQFEEQQAQKLVFINQMYYNIALCFCMMKDYASAEKYLEKCDISQELHSYEIYLELMEQIKGSVEVDEAENYMDLFSLRNKISKFIPKVRVPFLSSKTNQVSYRSIKLCIPYPKVEPPEISPKFHVSMVTQVDINQIQRRPEAPWIYKEKNSVKFTDRIDVYSRFEMQKSQIDKSAKRMHVRDLLDSSSSDQKGQFNLKKYLRLDSQTENKLNKLLKKKK